VFKSFDSVESVIGHLSILYVVQAYLHKRSFAADADFGDVRPDFGDADGFADGELEPARICLKAWSQLSRISRS
jgi:hypothetical protein